MARREELTDEQWAILGPLIPAPVRQAYGCGRPVVHSDRAALNGTLWVLPNSAAWANLPNRLPSGCICFRRFARWIKDGVMRQILEALARHLEQAGKIDLSECLIGGSFVVTKKRFQSGKGSPNEVTVVDANLDKAVTAGRLRRLIRRDRSYASDPLDQRLADRGIELIATYRNGRIRPATQHGRTLHLYRRR